MYIETIAAKVEKLISELDKYLSSKEFRKLNKLSRGGKNMAEVCKVAELSTNFPRRVLVPGGYMLQRGEYGGTEYRLTEKFDRIQSGDILDMVRMYAPDAKHRPVRSDKLFNSRVVETQLPGVELRTDKALSILSTSEFYALSEKNPLEVLSDLDKLAFLKDLFPKYDEERRSKLIQEYNKL